MDKTRFTLEGGVEFLSRLFTQVMSAVERSGSSVEIITRLGEPEGYVTLRKMIDVARVDWLAEQPPQRLRTIAEAKLAGTEIISVQNAVDQEEFFEVLVWKPKNEYSDFTGCGEVRKHFNKLGFCGHKEAFKKWCEDYHDRWGRMGFKGGMECFVGGIGYFLSIPDDDDCEIDDDDDLCAPYFVYEVSTGNVDYGVYDIDESWGSHWTFVAFRKLTQGRKKKRG